MCGGQTELQKTLVLFQFTNPSASVSYRNGGLVNITVDERELKDLENHLDKLSNPHKLLSLSVKYTKNEKTYNHNLYHIVKQINATNIGRTKKGYVATHFDNIAKDIDEYTGGLSDLSGDDSGSFGCQKKISVGLQDSEVHIGGSSTVGICGTVKPLYGITCPAGYFYSNEHNGIPDQYPCVPNGSTCNINTWQQ